MLGPPEFSVICIAAGGSTSIGLVANSAGRILLKSLMTRTLLTWYRLPSRMKTILFGERVSEVLETLGINKIIKLIQPFCKSRGILLLEPIS